MEMTLLENLWFSYEIENHTGRTEETIKISKKLNEKENALREQLSTEQGKLFDEAQTCMTEMNCVYEKTHSFTVFASRLNFCLRH